MYNNINEKFLIFEFKFDMEMVKLYERNFNIKIFYFYFYEKKFENFFLKNGLKVKEIYRINGEIKIEIF